MTPRVFGMITTAASRSYTPHAISSFLKTTPLSTTDTCILIVNDGDFSSSEITASAPFTVIKNSVPKGFAENMNGIMREAITRGADAILLNNDIIFTDGWLAINSQNGDAISSPLSSREMQYQAGELLCTNPMTLEQYLGKEHLLDGVIAQHRSRMLGLLNVLALPFFAVTIPLKIMKSIGLLDESFGKGGGEDYDYCLRAILAGFKVQYILSNYLIHFGGRSSWAGHETEAQIEARNAHFFARFTDKWGEELTNIILRENHELIMNDSHYASLAERGDHKTLILSILQKESKIPPKLHV